MTPSTAAANYGMYTFGPSEAELRRFGCALVVLLALALLGAACAGAWAVRFVGAYQVVRVAE